MWRELSDIPLGMTIPITVQIHRDGRWFVAFCAEFPEASGKGESRKDCIENLKASIQLLLEEGEMKVGKRRRLEDAGWIETTVEEVLDLSPADMEFIEAKLERHKRLRANMSL